MKERPILLRDREVIAVLAGTKTQLRRVIKPQPETAHDGEPYWLVGGYRAWRHRDVTDVRRMGTINELRRPFGMPGDRLWVRETFSPLGRNDALKQGDRIYYRADGDSGLLKWRSPVQMPRWASRITLEVARVRVERLQDISDGDSLAEGIYPTSTGLYPGAPRAEYQRLWEDIHGAGSWDANPWVWAVEFRVAPNHKESS